MKSEIFSLGTLCKRVVSGGTPKSTISSYYCGNIPWLNSKEVHFNRIYKTEKSISIHGLQNSSAKWIPSNCVIIAMYGATAGNVAINLVPLTTNQACCNLEIDETKANYKYIYYYLKMNYKKLSLLANGGAQQNLNSKLIKDFPIILPPLHKQNYIANILWSIDNKIELNNTINDNLQQQAQTIYHEHFENISPDDLPPNWHIVSLGEVITISKKSFNPKKETKRMIEHYSIPAFDETKFPIFESSTFIKSNKFVIDASCFMISKLNPTTKRVWKPYCLTDNTVCSTEFIVYKAKDEFITDFLYSVIDSQSFSEFMCSHVTGSTGSRQRTTPSDTLSYKFVLPSNEVLVEFQSVVSPIYNQIRINAIETYKLKIIRDTLLPKLLSGEIDISDI